jgi:hypothetical protein
MAGGSTRSSPSKEDAQTHATPHLARNDESPQNLQNRQGTTAAASTSAVSSIAAIAATATTTTATMVVEVGDADPVDDESAEEDHGNGEVDDADPVHDESAEEDPIILSNSDNWIIEGFEELDKEKIRHMNAFYALLKKWIGGKEYTSKIITKEDDNARVNFLLRVLEGDIDCREGYLTGNVNTYKWLKRYHVFKYGDDSEVLVLCPSPKKSGAVDVAAMPLNILQQPTYAERLFIDLWKIHQADHCKGVTFFIAFGTSMAT